jgi:hypothetical protein
MEIYKLCLEGILDKINRQLDDALSGLNDETSGTSAASPSPSPNPNTGQSSDIGNEDNKKDVDDNNKQETKGNSGVIVLNLVDMIGIDTGPTYSSNTMDYQYSFNNARCVPSPSLPSPSSSLLSIMRVIST